MKRSGSYTILRQNSIKSLIEKGVLKNFFCHTRPNFGEAKHSYREDIQR